MQNMKKGFTLVEVLIVVVIIAILASLIVPRMLMQTEKAKAAEALQIAGAIKRAADRYYDFHRSYYINGDINSSPSSYSGNWADLGLQGIEKSQSYSYVYNPASVGDSFNMYVTSVASASNYFWFLGYVNKWQCYGTFKPINATAGDSVNSLQGCTI